MMRFLAEMRNMLLDNREKNNACYKVAENLAKLCSCSSVLWKVQLASNEIAYLAKTISK